MIVLQDGGTVYLAEPAATELCLGYGSAASAVLPENLQTWIVPNGDGIVACVAFSGFEADVLRYDSELITGKLTFEKLVLETVPKIRERLRTFGKLDRDGEAAVCLAFAQGDRAFTVTYGGCVSEITDYAAFGRFEERGLGALRSSEGLPPEERILFAHRMMNRHENCPVAIVDTKTLAVRVAQ